MIDWLGDKDPDVWFDVTQHMNWDSSVRVLDWIISQPQCDKANAAAIFWGADPLHYLRRLPAKEPWNAEGFDLANKVLRNWSTGFYRRSELAWPEDWRQRYRDSVASRASRDDPLSIPNELLGPLKGRAPNVPEEMRAENNAVLYDLLRALGTDVGWRPGGPKGHAYRDLKRRRATGGAAFEIRHDAVSFFVRDKLRSWRHSLGWLVPVAIVMIGGAFVMRWMVKGVLY